MTLTRECAMTNRGKIVFAAAAAVLMSACASPSAQTADAKPDARQGEEVSNICFSQQIRNWRENDNRSIIVEVGTRDEYKLDLMGTCQPQDAFMSVGLVSRVGGGSCLERGDKLVTDSRYSDGSCSIRRIYKWNKDAGKEQPAAS
jgi:hypothetical protein